MEYYCAFELKFDDVLSMPFCALGTKRNWTGKNGKSFTGNQMPSFLGCDFYNKFNLRKIFTESEYHEDKT